MNRNRAVLAVLSVSVALVLGIVWYLFQRGQVVPRQTEAALPAGCANVTFESAAFIVCTVEPATQRIELHLSDKEGKLWRSVDRFAAAMRSENLPILYAMNAGMYHEDLSPVGLFIANEERVAPLQTGSGDGNFFMKPNGVFGVYSGGQPFVASSDTYFVSPRVVEFATQSGPMLVIDGSVHPRFEQDGSSRNIRNGVGININGSAIFAISREPVSFGKFARLFRDPLGCRNALYFDGVVSAFSDNDSMIVGGKYPAGPIVAVFSKTQPTQ